MVARRAGARRELFCRAELQGVQPPLPVGLDPMPAARAGRGVRGPGPARAPGLHRGRGTAVGARAGAGRVRRGLPARGLSQRDRARARRVQGGRAPGRGRRGRAGGVVREGDAGRGVVAGIRGRSRSHGAHAHRHAPGHAGSMGRGQPHGGAGSRGSLRALARRARAAVATLGRARRARVALPAAAIGAAGRHRAAGALAGASRVAAAGAPCPAAGAAERLGAAAMCGITGIFHFGQRPVDRARLEAMTDVILHRGPDSEGFLVEGPVGLGHRRLAIIDLATGDQPMCNADGSLVVIFNGEIYNYVELRDELRKLGRTFRTGSDTEVILQAYEQWGVDCQQRLNGMWAFALWDRTKRQLFVSRDRLGEKPLHWAVHDDTFLFGSGPKWMVAYAMPVCSVRWTRLR